MQHPDALQHRLGQELILKKAKTDWWVHWLSVRNHLEVNTLHGAKTSGKERGHTETPAAGLGRGGLAHQSPGLQRVLSSACFILRSAEPPGQRSSFLSFLISMFQTIVLFQLIRKPFSSPQLFSLQIHFFRSCFSSTKGHQ